MQKPEQTKMTIDEELFITLCQNNEEIVVTVHTFDVVR